MKRRDFLKGAMVGAGLLGAGMLPGEGKAGSSNSNTFGKKRKGVDFYRIDAYCHLADLRSNGYLAELEALSGARNPQRTLIEGIRSLYDVGDRLDVMDACGIDLSIVIPQPFIESAGSGVYTDPSKALTAAQSANDNIAEIVAGHPDRLKWIALLPTNLPNSDPSTPSQANINIMWEEFSRAKSMGAVGACFVVAPTLKAPDHADYLELYKQAVELNLPLWIHPSRSARPGDYPGEVSSKYFLYLLLGYLLDSSVAMARIAFSGVFNDIAHPETFPKFVIHHKGALVSLFRNRLTYALYQTIPGLDYGIDPSVPQPYVDLFRNFYVDTAFSGDETFETEIAQIAYDFFGPDHVLFGTDAPFSTNDGKDGILNARYSVEAMNVPNKKIQNIFSNNILNIIPH